jgi:hypothetical protein
MAKQRTSQVATDGKLLVLSVMVSNWRPMVVSGPTTMGDGGCQQ